MTPRSRAVRDKSRKLTHADYAALARLRYLMRSFAAFSAAAAQAQGLPARQHQALLAIKGHAPDAMTAGVLAEHLLITPHAATELIDRLADAGLAVRRRDPVDRRRFILALTAKAERTLRALSLAHLREIRATTPALLAVLGKLERRAND